VGWDEWEGEGGLRGLGGWWVLGGLFFGGTFCEFGGVLCVLLGWFGGGDVLPWRLVWALGGGFFGF